MRIHSSTSMFLKWFSCSLFVASWTINLAVANAQSWQDWAEQNPTYQAPAPKKEGAAPKILSNPSTPQSPASSWSNPPSSPHSESPGSSTQDYFSTQNPLFEQQFMVGCQQEQLPISYCQCTLKEIQNTYTFSEVVQISTFMQKNAEIPSEIIDVAMKCIPS